LAGNTCSPASAGLEKALPIRLRAEYNRLCNYLPKISNVGKYSSEGLFNQEEFFTQDFIDNLDEFMTVEGLQTVEVPVGFGRYLVASAGAVGLSFHLHSLDTKAWNRLNFYRSN